jgi:hypothetical protein
MHTKQNNNIYFSKWCIISLTGLNRLPVSSPRALGSDTSLQVWDGMPVLRPPLGTVMTHTGMRMGQKLGGSNSWRQTLLALPGCYWISTMQAGAVWRGLPPYLWHGGGSGVGRGGWGGGGWSCGWWCTGGTTCAHQETKALCSKESKGERPRWRQKRRKKLTQEQGKWHCSKGGEGRIKNINQRSEKGGRKKG